MSDDQRHSVPEKPELVEDTDERAALEAANALRQFDAVLDEIDYVARDGRNFRLRVSTIFSLHGIALDGLTHFAGIPRSGPVRIGLSKHVPPDASRVTALLEEMCDWVNDNWEESALRLCAYVMWRLNWIHPFEDGNGRTSRAVAYMVLCSRLGDRLPGNRTIPEQIAENKTPYYEALEQADQAWEQDRIDVTAMEELLEQYLAAQLKSVFDLASAPGDPNSNDRKFH